VGVSYAVYLNPFVYTTYSQIMTTPCPKRVCPMRMKMNLTFICPCITNIFAEYNQQDAMFHNLFIPVRRSTCFRRVFRPSSGARNCTYSIRYLSDQYCYLLLAWPEFRTPDEGRKSRLKHAQRLTDINKL